MNDILIKDDFGRFEIIIHKEGLPWTCKNMKSLVKLINTEVSFNHNIRDSIFDRLLECLEYEKNIIIYSGFKSKMKLCERNIEIIKNERR